MESGASRCWPAPGWRTSYSPLSGEGPLDQALAGARAAGHVVDFAVGEDAAGGLAAEAAAAVGDVAQLPHRLLEADDDVAALALVQGGEADPPALALAAVPAEPGGGGVAGACRVLPGPVDPDPGPEGAAVALALLHLDALVLDPLAVEEEADVDALARGVGADGPDHRDRAHHLSLPSMEVADRDLHLRVGHGVDGAVLVGGERGRGGGERGEEGDQRDQAFHRCDILPDRSAVRGATGQEARRCC